MPRQKSFERRPQTLVQGNDVEPYVLVCAVPTFFMHADVTSGQLIIISTTTIGFNSLDRENFQGQEALYRTLRTSSNDTLCKRPGVISLKCLIAY